MAYIRVLVVVACVASTLVSEISTNKCDPKVIQCIKDVNGGKSPANLLTSLNMLWNKYYSICLYSEAIVKKQPVTCITTKFSMLSSIDKYIDKYCKTMKEVKYKTQFVRSEGAFSILGYEGVDYKAYPIHIGKFCITLYVCSPAGADESHSTIYCLSSNFDKKEIEEGKAKLAKCNIDDVIPMCQQKC
uniref:Lipocalin/cytosolic fatty-acid binding domain-containing protein n=1 Tax=Graphocephala atropunctata TaxID=36148 RepID=A0A1B6LGT9_9HEMI